MEKPELPGGLHLEDVVKYAPIVQQLLAVVKSLQASAVGTTHTLPKTKMWIGDGYWEVNLGTWRRLK